MSFADELKNINGTDEERIQFTCKLYIEKIIQIIHTSAKSAAEVKNNHIAGYLSKIGPVSVSAQSLGWNLHYDNDPLDFSIVLTLNGGAMTGDPLVFSQKEFDSKVLRRVKEQLIEDGFKNFDLHSECIKMYDSVPVHGLFNTKYKHVLNGKEELYVFVDLHW